MWTLYKINCHTPNHIYIGISRNVWHRLLQHAKKLGSQFTKRHGVKSFELVKEYKYEDEAIIAERNLVLYYKTHIPAHGLIVCGAGWSGPKGCR